MAIDRALKAYESMRDSDYREMAELMSDIEKENIDVDSSEAAILISLREYCLEDGKEGLAQRADSLIEEKYVEKISYTGPLAGTAAGLSTAFGYYNIAEEPIGEALNFGQNHLGKAFIPVFLAGGVTLGTSKLLDRRKESSRKSRMYEIEQELKEGEFEPEDVFEYI